MPRDDVDLLVIGRIQRTVEGALAGRRDLDEAARKRIAVALRCVVDDKGPTPESKRRGPVCTLCGQEPIVPRFVQALVGPGRTPAFSFAGEDVERRAIESGALFCRSCMFHPLHLHDADVTVARTLLAADKQSGELLPVLDGLIERRTIQPTSGRPCALCGRIGAALRGSEGVICLVCLAGARAAFDENERRIAERVQQNEARYERELADYLGEMRGIARTDARAVIVTLQRRARGMRGAGEAEGPDGEAAPAAAQVANALPRAARTEQAVLPGNAIPYSAHLAQAVSAKIASSRNAAAAWLRARMGDVAAEPPAAIPADPSTPTENLRSIPVASGPHDHLGIAAIDFLDREVERALRHDPTSRDLMGDRSGLHQVYAAFNERSPLSPAVLERVYESLSMLRQVLHLGILFYDFTGDELINEVIPGYEHVASWVDVGVHDFVATAVAGGLLVTGGTAADRARVADAIHTIVLSRNRGSAPFETRTQFCYVEASTLYAMAREGQAEIRRRMLVTPPWTVVLGADDFDTFIEETPRRVNVRIVTYLFMNGQEHLDLDALPVHVGARPPARPLPRRQPLA